MQKQLNNPYGYKVGYHEIDSRLFTRIFITRTFPAARSMMHFYRKYGHDIAKKQQRQRVNYDIIPITKKEFLEGIWDEPPFEKRHLFW